MCKQGNELMQSQIELFAKQTGYILKLMGGKLYHYGWLSCNSDYLPDNLVVDGNLNCSITSTRLPKGLKVTGYLDISMTNITEIPDDCEFNDLYMKFSKITKLRDDMMLFSLDANDSSLTELPKGLKVKDMLNISHTGITEIPDDCEFGSLFMEDTKINKLRDNLELKSLNVCGSSLQELPNGLKVKWYLNVSRTDITEIPNDCEFGSLNISNTKITTLRDNLVLNELKIINTPLEKLPNNLVVYFSLFMANTPFTTIPNDCLVKDIYCRSDFNDERYKEKGFGFCYYLKDEIVHISHPSGREFLHVDGILSEVIEKKGNVYHVRNGINRSISYVVTDGNNHWAHGDTLEKAKQDLIYKISERDKSKYENLTLESELPYYEAIACYRVITGACRMGTQEYLEHRLPTPHKEKYTIREMIELTKTEYGSQTFKEFFVTE